MFVSKIVQITVNILKTWSFKCCDLLGENWVVNFITTWCHLCYKIYS